MSVCLLQKEHFNAIPCEIIAFQTRVEFQIFSIESSHSKYTYRDDNESSFITYYINVCETTCPFTMDQLVGIRVHDEGLETREKLFKIISKVYLKKKK